MDKQTSGRQQDARTWSLNRANQEGRANTQDIKKSNEGIQTTQPDGGQFQALNANQAITASWTMDEQPCIDDG